MHNSGIEIELNFTPIRREKLQWDINLNMTHLRNRITMLPPERRNKTVEGYHGYVSGTASYLKKGQDIVDMNHKAIDLGATAFKKIDIPADWANAVDEPDTRVQ